MTKRIAILGATGHIARDLIERLGPKHSVTRYSRSDHRPFPLLMRDKHDVIINCVGVRVGARHAVPLLPGTEPWRIFEITERFDSLCLDYLLIRPETLYINFSSGAVFGDIYCEPAWKGSIARYDVNSMGPSSPATFYGIAKLNSEAKHRALNRFNIVDIRVFSYFSRHLPAYSLSIMNEILACVREGREMATSPQDFARDFIHPDDLARLVERCIDAHDLNTAFDAYSLLPVKKFDILEYFKHEHGLRYRIDNDFPETSPTGPKPKYYSMNVSAKDIGYYPHYAAMDAIKQGAEEVLSREDAKEVRSAECGVRSSS